MTPIVPPHEIHVLSARLLPLGGIQREELLEGDPRPAAVLVLLAGPRESLHVPLTVRPISLRSHPGQISLPGGRAEMGDRDLWHTAARETEEELGIGRHQFAALGRLTDLHLRRSNHLIAPFVGWMPRLPALHPNPSEVDRVINAPLDAFLDPATLRQDTWEVRGQRWKVTYYQIGEDRVWGATARMLGDLAERIKGHRLHPDCRPGDVTLQLDAR